MEIKHGRLSMAAFLGVITTYSGLRWPGYLSTSMDLKFEDIPGGAIASWAALPAAAWFQIVLIISFFEIAFFKQDPAKAVSVSQGTAISSKSGKFAKEEKEEKVVGANVVPVPAETTEGNFRFTQLKALPTFL